MQELAAFVTNQKDVHESTALRFTETCLQEDTQVSAYIVNCLRCGIHAACTKTFHILAPLTRQLRVKVWDHPLCYHENPVSSP